MNSLAIIYVPRLLIVAMLFVLVLADWRAASIRRQEVEALKYNARRDILQSRLDEAIRRIRLYNGDHAVQLANGDGSLFIDRLDPGESITFQIPVSPGAVHIPGSQEGDRR